MLKSSSLCLYSSNLGTFWLKIKQFWPFEEIYIFCNSGHLGWRAWLSDITFKGNPLRMIQAKFGLNWPSGFRGEDFFLKFCQWLATGQWFSLGTPVSSTNKTDHDIIEILLKIALNTINPSEKSKTFCNLINFYL
jgi:hypothetical protein